MLVLLLLLLLFIFALFIIIKNKEDFDSYSIDAMDTKLKYEVEKHIR